MSYILQSNTEKALQKGTETAVIAGVMAVGILLVSTVVRFYYTMKSRRKNRKA